jgi:integrase
VPEWGGEEGAGREILAAARTAISTEPTPPRRKSHSVPRSVTREPREYSADRCHTGRSFPFSALPPLAALLEAQREHTRTVERETGKIVRYVFHRRGERIGSIREAWNGACRRAGVPDAIFHDLRRTAVRRLERAGVPRSVAMKLTGHKTEAVYRRYAIADHAALHEGVGKLAKLFERPPEPATVVSIAR